MIHWAPKINGVEAVAYFRREYPAIPVIVLSGFPDAKLAAEFMKQGAFDYLVKPAEKETLIEVVTKAASQRHNSGGSNIIAWADNVVSVKGIRRALYALFFYLRVNQILLDRS